MRRVRVPIAMLGVALALGCGGGGDPVSAPTETEGEAAAAPASNPLRDAYFGDLHVHTSFSIDSYIFGNRLTPRDAYRFARGEEVTIHGGTPLKLRTPLDFAAVTDHAEGLEVIAICVDDESNPQYSSAFCEGIREGDLSIFAQGFARLAQRPPRRFEICDAEGMDCPGASKGPWQEIQRIAGELDQPGTFTALIGFEYSPTLRDGGMLHRNVIFRGDAVTAEAAAVWDLHTQADFWAWLERSCTGDCRALAIPHNSNYSWGLTFADTNDDGRPYSADDWARRARLEPVVEITQHKGSSECALGLGTNDEECAFEQFFPLCREGQETGCAREGGFVRDGLERGLELVDEIGTNPYKLGFIGSTDTHNSIPGATVEEDFRGHHAGNDDTAEKRLGGGPRRERPNLVLNPGGLAGVWAEANTRGAIFDALQRKETFATSGTRIQVRFFGGFDLPLELEPGNAGLEQAYASGVPMGGDLRGGGAGTPRFLVWAIKDAAGADLDRVQVIKGSIGASGAAEETIFDVACAGREPDPVTHRCASTTATVSEDCVSESGRGAAELRASWIDPSFDPGRRSFYYLRVLENPTCRWSTWEALREGVPAPSSQPRTVQERAWSSPIWYTP